MNGPGTTSRDIWEREECGPIGGAARLGFWIGNEGLNVMIAARALFSIAVVAVVFNSPVFADRTARAVYRCGGAVRPDATRDRLVELNMVSTTVLFDPEADYYRQGGGILDEDHHLLVAQRLHYKLCKRGAYTVRGRDRQELTAARRVAIRAIMVPVPEPKGRVPTVPAPPKEISGQLAVNR